MNWKAKNFDPSEFVEPGRMNPYLLTELDRFREFIKQPVRVTSSIDGVHEVDSEHYKGNAVDLIFPWLIESSRPLVGLLDFYLKAERFNFTGIGIYSYWQYNKRVIGGLHLDVRSGGPARWLCNSKGKYEELTFANLMKYFHG